MNQIVGTFTFGVKGELDYNTMAKALTVAVVNKESFTEFDESGMFLVIKKQQRMLELEKAQHRTPHNVYLDMEYDLMDDGRCVNYRVKAIS